MQSQERQKQQRLTLKSQVDDMESEISEIRKKLSTEQKEITAMQKAITSLETKLEQKRADRHSLLKSCKVRRMTMMQFFPSVLNLKGHRDSPCKF